MQTVQSADLNGTGGLRLVRQLLDIESEDRKNGLELVRQFAGQDIGTKEYFAFPAVFPAHVNHIKKLFDFRHVRTVIRNHDRIRTGQFHADGIVSDERPDLVDNLFRSRIFQRIIKQFSGAVFRQTGIRLLRHFRQRHDPQQRSLHRDARSGKIQHFVKRIPEFTARHLLVNIQRHDSLEVAVRKEIEAERIRAAIPHNSLIIAMDERGKDLTTEQFAQKVRAWRDAGESLCFIIGGADGLDPQLKSEARMMLRLSSMTLPHAMARVMLAEQIYRAFSILTNHPYHRA